VKLATHKVVSDSESSVDSFVDIVLHVALRMWGFVTSAPTRGFTVRRFQLMLVNHCR